MNKLTLIPNPGYYRTRFTGSLVTLLLCLSACGSGSSSDSLISPNTASVANESVAADNNGTNNTNTSTEFENEIEAQVQSQTEIDNEDISDINIEANAVIETEAGNNSETSTETETVTNANNQTTSATIGEVRTIQINNVILTSLPDAIALPDSEKVELGRLLFWDPILSGDLDVACATCHLPEFGYGDGRERSVGVGGIGAGPARSVGHTGVVPRNAPTVLNTAWNGINQLGLFNSERAPMFWDNRTQSLALQALEPLRSQQEMRGDSFTIEEIEVEVISRLNANSDYQARFQSAYSADEITLSLLGTALADFQTTLIANNAPFDRWMRGDTNAMTADQVQGMEAFVEVGCAKCHSGPMFSDYALHVLGVAEATGLDTPDTGDGNFAFRTPTLRQLAFTAPYFHGGQDSTLKDVIDFYDNPENSENPNVPNDELDDDFLNMPTINGQLAERIEQFLNALNDDQFDRSKPESVPSGLPVGGLIE